MTPLEMIAVIKAKDEGKTVRYSPYTGPLGWHDMTPEMDFDFTTFEYRAILKDNFYISRCVKFNLETREFEVSVDDVQNIQFLINGETGEVISVEMAIS